MLILPAGGPAVKEASKILREGGVIAFPTETVYGLGADAFNAAAVSRIFEIKNRPLYDPLIIHIGETGDLEKVCVEIPELAYRLIERFWPGPLTLVLRKKKEVPELVTSGLENAAVRMPAHEAALALIREAGTPLAAPSANPFGYISPTTALHVAEQLGGKVDMILDGGPCRVGVESTVLDLTESVPVILRSGGIAAEEIESAAGKVVINAASDGAHPKAPGRLLKHYAPRTPLKIVKSLAEVRNPENSGALCLKPSPHAGSFKQAETLSSAGDFREAAANLYSAMHRLDAAGLRVIYAEEMAEEGLGRAVMDRLRRAAFDPSA